MAENIKKWKLEPMEIGIYLPIVGSSSGPFPLNIPKLMPDIPRGIPKVNSPVGLSDGCFCNSSQCKPVVSKTIVFQNFYTVPLHDNRGFKAPLFRSGAVMQVDFENGDVYQAKVNNKVDNSVSF